MDLPTCPHCGQSVLDDDAEDCPFCGESMSSKPAKKKPAPQSVASAKPSKASATESSEAPAKQKPAKPAAASKAPSSDAEPFAVDKVAMSNAVPLRPKPTKGRTYEVVCPMCETTGYTSPKAGGREVKCANPKCLVPIFTCPEPPPAPVETEADEPAGLSTTQLGLISVVALAAIGAGIWFFVLKEDGPKPGPQFPDGQPVANSNDPNTKTQPEENTDPPKEITPIAPTGPDFAKLRLQALDEMIETSKLSSRSIQRPIPLRIQGIALAYADVGDLQSAEDQLARLSTLSDDRPHYRVRPWVEIAWKRLAREESAEAAADKALEAAKDLPASSQESWVQAVSLTALLTALDRGDETEVLMNRGFGRAPDQQFWAEVMAVSLDRSFNLEAIESVRPLATPLHPANTGVIWQLVFHNASGKALAWAKSDKDPQARGESLIAFADASMAKAIQDKKTVELTALDAAIDELPAGWPAVVTARAYSRMGGCAESAGDETQADALLKTALSALAKLPKPKAMPLPDLKTLYALKFSATELLDASAVAAFEVARLQASLDHADDAWKSIEQGLAILRSIAPSIPEVDQLVAQYDRQADSVKSDLQKTLNLESQDEVSRAFRNYQRQVNLLKSRAESRFRLQASLLSQAASWKLADKVQAEILESLAASAGDPYLETDLPWIVLAAQKEQGSPQGNELDAKLKERRISKPQGQTLLEESAQAMQDNDLAQVVADLGRGTSKLADTERRRWILRLCTREVLKGNTEKVAQFLLAIYKVDPFLGEDAAELLAALATRNGQGETVWKTLKERGSWPPLQKIAAYRGFVAAIDPTTE